MLSSLRAVRLLAFVAITLCCCMVEARAQDPLTFYKAVTGLQNPGKCKQKKISRQTISFNFDREGKYQLFNPGPIDVSKRASKYVRVNIAGKYFFYFTRDGSNQYALTTSINPSEPYDPKKVNKQLAARIRMALDNIDDSLPLQNFYKQLFGAAEFTTLLTQLGLLSKELKSGIFDLRGCPATYNKFPEFCVLENKLAEQGTTFSVNLLFVPDSNRFDIFINKSDPFQEAFLNYWRSLLPTLTIPTFTDADHAYKKGWEQLGNPRLPNRMQQLYDSLAAKDTLSCQNPPDLESFFTTVNKFISDTLQKNEVLRMIHDNRSCYTKTFWFNYGYFSTNPLGFTSTDRSYRVNLFDKEAARLHDSLVNTKLDEASFCCTVNMNGIDSLIRLRNTGKKLFSTDTVAIDPIWGFNDLHALRTSTRIRNKMEIPVLGPKSFGHPQLLLQFDGPTIFRPDVHNVRYKRIGAEDSLNFIIHNIPKNYTVALTQVSQSTTNTSSFQDALATLNGVTGLNTAATTVPLTLLSPPRGAANQIPDLQPFTQLQFERKEGITRNIPETLTVDFTIPGFGKMQFIVTRKTTKKSILNTFCQFEPAADHCKDFVDSFFIKHCETDNKIVKNWSGDYNEVAANIRDLILKYIAFATSNKDKHDQIAALESTLSTYSYIAYLQTITDRSLPPLVDSMTSLTDSTPDYRSQVFAVPVYDSTRAVQATVVAKKIVKKDTTTYTHPIYPSTRIGTLSRFAFSAGIAVTPGLYIEKTATTASGQLVVTNSTSFVGYMVGLHTYPWKYLPLDNSFLGFKSHHFWQRVSVYTGVAIPNPLQDYYGGFSFDLVPGFKLVTGAHLFMNTRYQLINNQISSQASAVKYTGTFVSICIDPSAFVTVLGLFK